MRYFLIARSTYDKSRFVLESFETIEDALKRSNAIQRIAFDNGECATGFKLVYAKNKTTALRNLNHRKNYLPNSNF